MSDKPIPTVDEVLERWDNEWTQDCYCRGTFARTKRGTECQYYADNAEKFCGVGFTRYLTFDHREFDANGCIIGERPEKIIEQEHPLYQEWCDIYKVERDTIRLVEDELPCKSVIAANDTPNGFNILKRAIKKARDKRIATKEVAGEQVDG